jgi:GNAT superfamily N-acetyltransferase
VALRPADPEDAEFLLRVYASTRAQELAPVPWSDAQKDAFLRMQFTAQDTWWRDQKPTAEFHVILVGGAAAGRLYVDRRPAEIRVVDIALLPEYRGHGVGAGLLGALIDEGDKAGKPVTIHVEAGNRARGLYERLGFREISHTGVYALMERPAPVTMEVV